jgi:PKD repeat protein
LRQEKIIKQNYFLQKNKFITMKLIITILFFAFNSIAFSQGFTKAEYFFDTDPGVDNGISIPLSGNSDTLEFTSIISTSSLTSGFHQLGFRVKNTDGYWGLNETRSFYIFPLAVDLPKVTGIEYFFDTDPGVGNATMLNLDSAVAIFNGNVLLPIGNLSIGNHQLVIRVKNSNQKWSLMENRPFRVCTIYGPKSVMNFHIEQNKVFFTNQSTGADSTKWLFGDNTSDTVLNPIKTYGGVGNYTVKLISTNACAKDTLTQLVSINGLQTISGKYGSDTGIASITFDGIGFNTGTPIKIVKGNTVYLPLYKEFISANRIIGYFNFVGAVTGEYDAVADITATAFDTVKNAYSIIPFKRARVFIAGALGPQFTRPGLQYRAYVLQNEGTEDAIMVPFILRAGYKTGILSPQIFVQDEMLDLSNEGIFQNTYQYLTANNIALNAMQSFGIDTLKNRQLYASYKIRVPAKSNIQSRVLFVGNQGGITYETGSMVQASLYNSNLVTGNTQSIVADCMNSFLRKAVRNNLAITIDTAGWNNCFYSAFDTLTKSIKAIAQNMQKSQKSIPLKAVFSTLLAQISQCNASGLPANLNSMVFNKIIKEVTYNWIFLENLDSLGRPCFDTSENFVFGNNLIEDKNNSKEIMNANIIAADPPNPPPCQGLLNSPELLEQCLPFIRLCKLWDAIGFIPGVQGVAAKFSPLENFACKLNSGAAFCEKICEGNASDPNVKNGPGDNFTRKHVNTILNNTYSIFFENLATATANAAFVEIKDTIDKTKLDIATLQLGSFGWGDSIIVMNPNRTNYSILKDLRPLRPNKLRIDFSLDTAIGVASWKFFTVDTSSLQLTLNPSEGFLPPNINGREGVGFVSFNIHPKQGVTSGVAVQNKASIVFDNNTPIITPVWEHIFDTTRPQSQVAALPIISNNKNFVVSWGGTDAHAGIANYSIYYSVNDSTYKTWKSFTTLTSDTFYGAYNKLYKFFSVALDNANNFELIPDSVNLYPDAYTTPQAPLPLKLLSFTGSKLQNPNKVKLNWVTTNEVNTKQFQVQRSANGNNFVSIGNEVAKNNAATNTYNFIDSLPINGINYYRLKQIDTDARFTISNTVVIDFNSDNKMFLYPTIVQNEFIVDGTKPKDNLQIIDVLGRVVGQLVITHTNQPISAISLPNGVYLVKVFGANKVSVFKMMKQ